MKFFQQMKSVLLSSLLTIMIGDLVNAQTWSIKTSDDFIDVVAIVKPRKTGNCKNHKIRGDGRVYDGIRKTKSSYLIVDQIVTLTGTTKVSKGTKMWEVFYEPSETIMWLNDCDLSIPKIVN